MKLKDLYSVDTRNRILQTEGQGAVEQYIQQVIAVLNIRAATEGFDAVYGRLLSAASDHEDLADFFMSNHAKDIGNGGLATDVKRCLKELTRHRKGLPFSG